MNQITTYATLQAAIAGMLHRASDTNITDNAALFIQMCEADLNDRLVLKNMESDEPLTLTANANYVVLPTGFVSPLEFWISIDSIRRSLTFALPEEMPYSPSASIPQFCAIDGANLLFDCPAADAYGGFLRCIKASNLSTSNTTNYLLLKRPDVYLYGTLKQACLFTGDDAGASKWHALYESAINKLKASDARNRAIVPLRTEFGGAGRRANIFNG